MKTIDFLPEYYRQRNELRRARVWWGICAAIFGVVVSCSAASQWWLKRNALAQLALVEPLYQAAKNQDQRFAAMQAEVAKEGEAASLYVYLKHRWPTSQLLAALARDLPAEVTLGGFDIADETSAATPDPHASATRTKEAAPPGTSQDGTPFQRDLERLRSEYDSRQQFIELRGVTTDDAHLHAYLLKLGEHPLIVSAQLQSITVVPAAKGPSTSRFVARLLVRPGYGQPRGPDVTEKAKKDKPAEKTEQSVSAATPEAQS